MRYCLIEYLAGDTPSFISCGEHYIASEKQLELIRKQNDEPLSILEIEEVRVKPIIRHLKNVKTEYLNVWGCTYDISIGSITITYKWFIWNNKYLLASWYSDIKDMTYQSRGSKKLGFEKLVLGPPAWGNQNFITENYIEPNSDEDIRLNLERAKFKSTICGYVVEECNSLGLSDLRDLKIKEGYLFLSDIIADG